MENLTLKEKVQVSGDEELLMKSNFEHLDEMNLMRTINNGNTSSVYPFRLVSISMTVYDFIKTYLYGLNSGVLKNDRLKIISFIGLSSATNPIASAPKVAGFSDEGLAVVENRYIIADLLFDNARYQVTVFFLSSTSDGMFMNIKHYISSLGIDNRALKTQELIDYLNEESMKNSIYKNKIINVSFEGDGKFDTKLVNREKFENEKIDEIFIPAILKNELLKFNECVKKFSTFGNSLRYMLCGEPGTGKTKSVRTMINMCYGKATIIMAEGEIRFKLIFEIAKMLSPAIICFDDLDLLVGSREKNFDSEVLGHFLQQLDGFDKNNVFLLCTTNSKELIDSAASRPGRFDLVLDFGKINKANYIDIIKTNCKNNKIIELFDDVLLDLLKKKKVTGAFIVNLIKQLEIKYNLEPKSDLREYIEDFMKISYKGFYEKHKDEELVEFGFSGSSIRD